MTVGSEIQLRVAGLTESVCWDKVIPAIHKLDPAAYVRMDLDEGLMDVITTQPHVAVIMAVKENGGTVLDKQLC